MMSRPGCRFFRGCPADVLRCVLEKNVSLGGLPLRTAEGMGTTRVKVTVGAAWAYDVVAQERGTNPKPHCNDEFVGP